MRVLEGGETLQPVELDRACFACALGGPDAATYSRSPINGAAPYETALDRLGEAARHADVLVPGHGAVAEGREIASGLTADHAYVDALRRGEEPVDARLEPDADWLSGPTARTWSRPDGGKGLL